MKKISLLLLLTISTLCLQAQCFDMGNLSAPGVTCTYGSYSNPYANVGIVNGRHTVMGGGYDDILIIQEYLTALRLHQARQRID